MISKQISLIKNSTNTSQILPLNAMLKPYEENLHTETKQNKSVDWKDVAIVIE